MLTLHSTFDLHSSGAEFKQAFDSFGKHLRDQDLVISWRFQQRHPHPGYDSTPPETDYYVSLDFRDMDQAEACWTHIEDHIAPGDRIHREVYSKIRDYTFWLTEDVG
jgi:hypothetical protein